MSDLDNIRRAEGETNRARVYDALLEEPGITRREVSKRLGLSEMAVGRHVRAIREGWRPEGEE